ncbi:MAG: proteasome-activating nucleotidase [Candidatus Freyarchaeota archaeon]|nr:proteasome-activating nucleotidase [Candidatus Freyrarchaeum guaymaensis]
MPGSTENSGQSYSGRYDDIIAYARDIERRLYKIDAERMRLRQEIIQLRKELEVLRQPPLIAATVLETLEDGRVIVRSSTGPNFVVYVSNNVPRDKLVPGAHVALSQKTFAIVEILPSPEDPFVRGMEVEEVPPVTYNDIGGLREQIREVRETVELPLTHPHLFEEVGVEPPKGVLLCGPPGTGKTLLARAVAHETKATFIRVVGSELVQKFIGEGARMVREVFNLARKKAPSIVFCDEIDAIGSRRLDVGTSGDREVQRTLMQLLSIMDGFDPRGDVRIIAATNRPDILDPALLRPGRFDRIIYFPLPDRDAREEIFRIHTRRMKLDSDVSLGVLAEMTENATGADIKAICTEAGMFAIRNFRVKVKFKDFEQAIEKVLKRKGAGGEPKGIYC